MDPKNIDINLESDLNRRDYLTAINIQIKLDIEPDVQILHFYGHDLVDDPATREAVLQSVSVAEEQAQSEYGVQTQPDIVTQEDGIRIFVPDLAVGETYWIILELNVPENKITIGSATIQYTDTVARQNVKNEIQLVESNSQIKSDVVVRHALSLWTSEVVYYALDDLYQYDLETARTRIENYIETLKLANEYINSDQIRDDIVTLNKFLSLSKNLGQINNPFDQNIQTMLFHTLNQFGDIRDGYNYTEFP